MKIRYRIQTGNIIKEIYEYADKFTVEFDEITGGCTKCQYVTRKNTFWGFKDEVIDLSHVKIALLELDGRFLIGNKE